MAWLQRCVLQIMCLMYIVGAPQATELSDILWPLVAPLHGLVPLILVTFMYHWCNIPIQLWYMTHDHIHLQHCKLLYDDIYNIINFGVMLMKLNVMLLSNAQKSPIMLLRNAHDSQNYATNFGQ